MFTSVLLISLGILKEFSSFHLASAVACTCNPATLKDVVAVPVGGNSPLIGGWNAWPPLIQHKN